MLKVKITAEKSQEIYAKIDKIFDETAINPAPMNYLVWYHYFLGENNELVNEINKLSNGAKSFNDRIGGRLYEQFIETPESKEQSEYDFAVKKFVDNILYQMNDFSDGIKNQSQQIGDYAKDLQNADLNPHEVEKIAQFIAKASESIQQNSDLIRDKVQHSSEEVKALRKQLEEAKKEAYTDELTQVANRKAFNGLIQDSTIEYLDQPKPLCLIMTDIDHFKSFNDTYGHPVGDSVLRYFASVLKKDSGEHETVCRYGGEEFAIVMKNTTIEQAMERAEQLRQRTEAVRLTLKDSNEPIRTITASFGIAQFNGQTDKLEDFINRADQSLYAAKQAGRNTVIHERMI